MSFVLEKPQQGKLVGACVSLKCIIHSRFQELSKEARETKSMREHAEDVGKKGRRKEFHINESRRARSRVNGIWIQPRLQQSVRMLTQLA